jgi:hypothetical protein
MADYLIEMPTDLPSGLTPSAGSDVKSALTPCGSNPPCPDNSKCLAGLGICVCISDNSVVKSDGPCPVPSSNPVSPSNPIPDNNGGNTGGKTTNSGSKDCPYRKVSIPTGGTMLPHFSNNCYKANDCELKYDPSDVALNNDYMSNCGYKLGA